MKNTFYDFNTDAGRVSNDISLRELVHEMLYGSNKEKARGEWVVLQKLVRDEDGNPIKHELAYTTSGEGRHKNRPAGMTRTGYKCTEHLVRCRHYPASLARIDEIASAPGHIAPVKNISYFSHLDEIKDNDVIVTLKVDADGNVINPPKVDAELIITRSIPVYGDNSRIEYYIGIIEDQK